MNNYNLSALYHQILALHHDVTARFLRWFQEKSSLLCIHSCHFTIAVGLFQAKLFRNDCDLSSNRGDVCRAKLKKSNAKCRVLTSSLTLADMLMILNILILCHL